MKRILSIVIPSLILGMVIGAAGLRLGRGPSQGETLAQGSSLRPTYLFNLPSGREEDLIVALAMRPGTRMAGGELIGETRIGYAIGDAATCETSGATAKLLQSFLRNDRFQCVMMIWKDN